MSFSSFFPVWERLTPQQQATLSGSVLSRRVRRGDVIHQGDADCTGLLLVKSGQLRAFMLSEDGREITLYRLFERDLCLFSASCMMRSIQFDITIQAEKDAELWVIPAETYRQVMEESAPLSNFTNEVMAARFSDVMWLIEQVLWKSFDRRLAAFLLEESAIEGTRTLKITHELIGNHMGNPREVVTRMLRYFQGEGLVRLSRGTVEIVDEIALRGLAE
ncbi:MAG TPA: Crp/Fnr family transcriptional regulator [Candidatus Limiplasma pullistercoris]|nr:Crp/Fnr family transcriptional regulator [Candidatus Limiplasma pullistercoris]